MAKENKYQNVSFSSVEEMLEHIHENERLVVELLRRIVTDCMPNCSEKLMFNIPSYKQHYSVCFIWPSAVKWGKVPREGVRFGFMRGDLLNDDGTYLQRDGRKQVYCRDFFGVNDVDIDLLKSYIYEAAAVDEQLYLSKRAKKR